MTPKVSVLMPAYNAERYIGEAIQSILDQTMQDFELIIVDDGSTDGTWGMIQERAARDGRIWVYKNERNLGVSASRNRLVHLASGEYIAWQDSDDVALPYRLEKQVAYLDSHSEIGICGGFLEFFSASGASFVRKYREHDAELRSQVFRHSPVAQPAAMLRKKILELTGYFDESLAQAEDLDLSFRIGLVSKFGNVQDVIIRYRQHDSLSRSGLRSNIIYTLKVRLRAARRGYIANSMDILFCIAALISLLLPASWIYGIFNRYRDQNIDSSQA